MFARSHVISGIVALITIEGNLLAASATPPPPDSHTLGKLWANLSDVLASADETDLIPITILMQEQVPRQRIDALKTNRDRGARRAAIKDLLTSTSEGGQRALVRFLESQERLGKAERIRTLWIVSVVAADVTPDVVFEIAARDDVDLVAHNPLVDARMNVDPRPDPPAWSGNIECGVELLGAPRVWDELGIRGEGVVVAHIDSGACYRHPDLEDQIWNNPGEVPDNGIDDDNNGYVDDIIGWDFARDNNDPDDGHGHGTHTAGTVLGDGTSGVQTGMAPGAKLMILKVSGQINKQAEMWIWRAMEYSADNGADVMTMSLGWLHEWGPVRRVWRDVSLSLIAMGTVPVIGAGNEGTCCPPFDHTRTPGDVPEVVTVGATDCKDHIAGFSSRGPVTWADVDPYNDWPPPGKLKPTVSAPGVDTESTRRCSGYTRFSGTSMATPHVSGAVALMLQANPWLSPEEVKEILIETSVDLGAQGWDNDSGAGRVDAFEAVQVALAMGRLQIEYPDGRPALIDPFGGTTMRVAVSARNDDPAPGSGKLHYLEGQSWREVPMQGVDENAYDAIFPPVECGRTLRYYISVENTQGDLVTDPFDAPDGSYDVIAASGFTSLFGDDFESDTGWTVVNENLDDGPWERAVPFGPDRAEPPEDYDGSGHCYVTGNAPRQDIDGGPTRLISPAYDLSDRLPRIAFAYWWVAGHNDFLDIEISNDDGATWVLMEAVPGKRSPEWGVREFNLSEFIEPTASVRLRISASDDPNNSIAEAGFDAFIIKETHCGGGGCVRDPEWFCDGDVDGDGQVNPVDSGLVQAAFCSDVGCTPEALCQYDLDCDMQINPVDAGLVQSLFGTCEAPREVCP